jgi:hypothetical protein
MGNQLKRLKKDRAMKKQLRIDIANFLLDMQIGLTQDPLGSWIDQMKTGIKGFYRAGNKELVESFEKYHEILNDPKKMYRFYTQSESKFSRYGDTVGLDEEENRQENEDMRLRANALMDRMVDQLLGLEVEDERKAASNKASSKNKRGDRSELRNEAIVSD